jgi:hypothetical protein
MKFQNAIRSVRTRQEGKIICQIIYLSLNFVFNYREQIAIVVLTFCKYKILRRVNMEDKYLSLNGNNASRTRKKCSFILKLISQMMTDQRKNINDDSRKHCGFTYTKQNPDGDDDARSKDKQSHLRFYEWMIMGTYVSFFFTKITNFGTIICLT